MSTETPCVTRALADWLSSHPYDALPARAKEKALDVIYDSVGAMTACSILPEVKTIVDVLALQGGREECSVGCPMRRANG